MIRFIGFAGVLLAFGIVLGTDYARSSPIGLGWLLHCRDEIFVALNSEDVQKLELFCLTVYLVVFWFQLRRISTANGKPIWRVETVRSGCLAGFCASALWMYSLGSPQDRVSTDVIVLFCGLTLGHGLLVLKVKYWKGHRATETHEDILNALVILLALSVLVQPDWWEKFPYRGHQRWQGPWWNPNHFGLLMAIGLVLAVGQGLQKLRHREGTPRRHRLWTQHLLLGFYVLAACLTGFGLVKSYSRGAWLGAALALVYLGFQLFRFLNYRARISGIPTNEDQAGPVGISWGALFLRNCLTLGLTALSVGLLVFWNCMHAHNPVIRRALSMGNVNDFSWRKRLFAYEGALQVMASKPWGGFGWDQPKVVYDQFYRPGKVDEGKVIELNDYFMVGMTLGLPALACFAGYLWLSLSTKSRERSSNLESEKAAWLRSVCRAAVIVLLVGFWLDRGLFWLALTTPFWILLELGREDLTTNGHELTRMGLEADGFSNQELDIASDIEQSV